MRIISRVGALVVFATSFVVAAGVPANAKGTTRVVHQGQSIQAAVNASHPYDTIIVEGVHREAVTLTTDAIHLLGRGALIEPPAGAAHTPCGEFGGDVAKAAPKNDVGICMLGQFDSHGNLKNPLSNVLVAGFTVRNFTDAGILMVGGQDVVVRDNVATNDGGYGVARFVSTGGRVENNQVSGNGEAGIYWGDSPHSNALVQGNHAYNNGVFGIFIRESSHGKVQDNVADGNCVGLIVVGLSNPAVDWTVQNNVSHNNNNACPGGDEGPSFSGIGIAVAGADHVRVLNNNVSNNKPSGETVASGGILVFSTKGPDGGRDPSNIDVHRNVVTNNTPANILWDHTGTNINLGGNSCTPGCS